MTISNRKTEKAKYQQSGFRCLTCGAHIKTYNGAKPEGPCEECGTGTFKMDWNQMIEATSIITMLPLDK